MISNERPSPYGNRPYGGGYQRQKRQVPEESLKTEKLQIERKTFVFNLKENPRGQFVRITEDVNGRRDTIIVPSTGLEEFKRVLESMIEAAADVDMDEETDDGHDAGEERDDGSEEEEADPEE